MNISMMLMAHSHGAVVMFDAVVVKVNKCTTKKLFRIDTEKETG